MMQIREPNSSIDLIVDLRTWTKLGTPQPWRFRANLIPVKFIAGITSGKPPTTSRTDINVAIGATLNTEMGPSAIAAQFSGYCSTSTSDELDPSPI
jgi:hypothetical protein